MLDESLPINDCSIYLNHENGVHFDVVVDVGEPVTIEKCKTEDKLDFDNFCWSDSCIPTKNIPLTKELEITKSCGSSYSELFLPINGPSQRLICSLLNLPLVSEHNVQLSKQLGIPVKCHPIRGDGNCFRALSFAVTGRQTYFKQFRNKIIAHMKVNLLYNHILIVL